MIKPAEGRPCSLQGHFNKVNQLISILHGGYFDDIERRVCKGTGTSVLDIIIL